MADNVSDNDLFVMFLAAPLALPVAAPLVFSSWEEGREWMIERGFIASPEDAVWEVPGWEGAGVSGAHVVLGVCLIVLVLALGSVVSRRNRSRRIDTEGWGQG
ncbi:hypothetical protein E1212_19340 [Jiangella ureilytica]|uniref:Uncharacterized protein n=1 Tax=Jiangella ureilytica TaxID=2530374 RepID=A0A4R4RKJ2_9ACTN|nr:hypothetical protein [Jiangella ureilytica]TDC49013.1 hypothetical protein E1212_19340 [Jiangella ureilytica]